MEMSVYGDPGAPIQIDSSPAALLAATVRQRDRLLLAFRSLDDQEWVAMTRCDGWDARALGGHLAEACTFFAATLGSSRRGRPTRYLEDFDPRTSPERVATRSMEQTPAQILASLDEAESALRAVLADYDADSDDSAWELPAEAPPGHVPARLSLQHALFDSWLHERDLLVPLGRTPPVHDDELMLVITYLAGLAALASLLHLDPFPTQGERLTLRDPLRRSSFEVHLGAPTRVTLRDDTGAAEVTADFVQLADAMSGRSALGELADPSGRPHQVLAGALRFLSPN